MSASRAGTLGSETIAPAALPASAPVRKNRGGPWLGIASALVFRQLGQAFRVGHGHLLIERAVHQQHRLLHAADRRGRIEQKNALEPRRVGLPAHGRRDGLPTLARHHRAVDLLLQRDA